MYGIRSALRRLLIAFAAFVVVLFGLAAVPAYATGDDGKTGTIEVCKKVQGPDRDFEFKFVIKKDGKEVKTFTLKKNECKSVDVEVGKFWVTEYVPKECEVTKIEIKGEGSVDLKKATAWVVVKKGETVTVTFFDKCKKEDCKN
jgi:hypothetical protein